MLVSQSGNTASKKELLEGSELDRTREPPEKEDSHFLDRLDRK